MATHKVTGDQKLFERACYMSKLKVTKFQLPTPNGFRAVLKKQAGAQICPPPLPVQNRLMEDQLHRFDTFDWYNIHQWKGVPICGKFNRTRV